MWGKSIHLTIIHDDETSYICTENHKCWAEHSEMLYMASKKLSALLENRSLTTEAIFGSVIKRPKNISFLKSISDSVEFKPKSLSRSDNYYPILSKESFIEQE